MGCAQPRSSCQQVKATTTTTIRDLGSDGGADVGIEVVGENGEAVDAKLPTDAPAKLDPAEVEEPTAEEPGRDLRGHDRIDDPVRMYLKEIGKVALLTAEEGVVLAKAIELGEQLVEAPWKGIVSLHEWTLPRHGAKDEDPEAAASAALRRRSPQARPRRDLGQGRGRPARPIARTSTSFEPEGRRVGRDEGFLKEAKKLVASYRRSREAPTLFFEAERRAFETASSRISRLMPRSRSR